MILKICEQCKKEFKSKRNSSKFCSRKCQYDSRKKVRKTICAFCKKEITKNYDLHKLSFCNMECRKNYQKKFNNYQKIPQGEKHPKYIKKEIKICPNCDQEFLKSWKTGNTFCSRECWRIHNRGKNHPNYNPFLDRVNKKDLPEYKLWSFKIKEISGFKCVKCASKKELNSHHIESWANNKKLRFDLSNGICLCKKCHIKLHSIYGYKTNLVNLENFLK